MPHALQEKVKKLLDIWTKTATFSPESLKSSYAKVGGTNSSANASPGPSESSSKRKEKHGDPRQSIFCLCYHFPSLPSCHTLDMPCTDRICGSGPIDRSRTACCYVDIADYIYRTEGSSRQAGRPHACNRETLQRTEIRRNSQSACIRALHARRG
jgi:hypothetical protein